MNKNSKWQNFGETAPKVIREIRISEKSEKSGMISENSWN